MPAGVGGTNVTLGTGTTDAACAQPVNTAIAVSTTPNRFHISVGLFFARALISALCSSRERSSVLSVLRASAHHRYSLSRGHNPSATATAATTDSTAAPTVAPDSTRRALTMSLRSWLRL